MFNSNVLLYPDTGDEFLSALRTSVLYSEHVFALTMVETEFAEKMIEAFDSAGGIDEQSTALSRRLRDYFEFVRDAAADLQMLSAEGVFTPLYADQSMNQTKDIRDLAFAQLSARFDQVRAAPSAEVSRFEAEMNKVIGDAFDICPPSYGDLDLIGHSIAVVDGKAEPVDLEMAPRMMMMPYLLLVAAFAEARKASVVTWRSEFREAVWTCRELFSEEDRSLVQRRYEAIAQLGHVVLERHLPAPDQMPFEAILELRQQRGSELLALRSGIAELASHVDVTQGLEQQNLQVHDLVLKYVDPSIRELRASIAASKRAAFKEWGRSWSSVAGATIPAVISFASGAPLDMSAVIAAVGSLVGPAAEGFVASRDLRHGSQWSLLLRLDDTRTA